MDKFWDATKLMVLVYVIAAVVSLLVAWIIKLTFVVIRMHSGGRAPGTPEAGESQAKSAQQGPSGGV